MKKLFPLLTLAALLPALPAAAQDGAQPAQEPTLTAASKTTSPEDASALPGMTARKPASAVSVKEAEFGFLKASSASADKDVLKELLPQVEDWLQVHPAETESHEAQLLKASLRARLGDYKAAFTDLYRYFYEYPGAASAEEAKKLLADTAEKKADKKIKPVLFELAAADASGDTAGRLAVMLDKVSTLAGDYLYEPLLGEYRAFFRRFPAFPGSDMLLVSLGDLHRREKEYLRARLSYERMIAVYPASPLLGRAKVSLAATLADDIRDYDAAIAAYQDIADAFPGTAEAWTAYGRLPALAERRDKFDLAVAVYEKIIELYPDRAEAYSSFNAEARVMREEMKDPAGAIKVLGRLADKYKGEKAIEALFLAAEIARKDMKDPVAEIQAYDRIVAEYAADPAAPKALYAAGEAMEKMKDYEKARDYYSTIVGKYADDILSKKAQKRIDGLLAR
jgi:tetratricopeptide (TPR) repeat protein